MAAPCAWSRTVRPATGARATSNRDVASQLGIGAETLGIWCERYGAALDVHEEEPLAAHHPLKTFDSVALTLHIAWNAEESYVELTRRALGEVTDVIRGIRPRNVLDPEVLDG